MRVFQTRTDMMSAQTERTRQNEMHSDSQTELHAAALKNDVTWVHQLLTVDTCLVNASDAQGFTPLHMAAQQQAVETARILITHGG